MTRNAKRRSIFAFATVAVEAVAKYGRRNAHLLFDMLQGAYDTHMERAQMRLAPVKQRSWCDIHGAPGARRDRSVRESLTLGQAQGGATQLRFVPNLRAAKQSVSNSLQSCCTLSSTR
jgi:hypothetical protein